MRRRSPDRDGGKSMRCGICGAFGPEHSHPDYHFEGVPVSAYFVEKLAPETARCAACGTGFVLPEERDTFLYHLQSHFTVEPPSEAPKKTMPAEEKKATPPKPKEKKPKAPKAAGEKKAPKVRSRVLEDRVSKDGKQVVVLVYVPKADLPKVMDRAKLGSNFGEFVRTVWKDRPENPRESEMAQPLVGRGVYVEKTAVAEIKKYEEAGGNFDRYVYFRLKSKLGL